MHFLRKRTWIGVGALAGGLSLGLVLYFFAPDQYTFYPRCAFYALTGLKCPGCGGLRAVHYVLHGEFSAAFHSNPLIVLLLPALALGLVYYGVRSGRPLPSILDSPGWLWVLLAVVIAFAVIRNLPFASR